MLTRKAILISQADKNFAAWRHKNLVLIKLLLITQSISEYLFLYIIIVFIYNYTIIILLYIYTIFPLIISCYSYLILTFIRTAKINAQIFFIKPLKVTKYLMPSR